MVYKAMPTRCPYSYDARAVSPQIMHSRVFIIVPEKVKVWRKEPWTGSQNTEHLNLELTISSLTPEQVTQSVNVLVFLICSYLWNRGVFAYLEVVFLYSNKTSSIFLHCFLSWWVCFLPYSGQTVGRASLAN